LKNFGPSPVPPLIFYDESTEMTPEKYKKIAAMKGWPKAKIMFLSTDSVEPNPIFKDLLK